jgi:hypothetical protein
MPDGIFPFQNHSLGKIVEDPGMENVGIFYVHLDHYFMAILNILWPFGTFFPFWYIVPRKIWQP